MLKPARYRPISTSAILLLPACSLLIDTTPDGVTRNSAGAGQSGDASIGASAGTLPSTQNRAGGDSSPDNVLGAASLGGSTLLGGATSTPSNVSEGGIRITAGQTIGGGATYTINSTTGGGETTPGSTASGGAAQSVGGAFTGASTTGGTAAGGPATSGSLPGSGCAGSLETVQVASGLCVAKMVSVTPPTNASSYSINATEVTRGQYAAWLASSPAPQSALDSRCGWNTIFVPDFGCMARACKSNCEHHPQVCVDWCDADRYCWAIGKVLCGKIGGGENPWTENANSETSQWHRACSSGGLNIYPYGSTYKHAVCNDYSYWAPNYNTTTVEVGSLPGCQSTVTGYTGVFDLSGNVIEWENSCEDSRPDARCNARGGLYFFDGPALACDGTGSYFSRDAATEYIGFRCCSY